MICREPREDIHISMQLSYALNHDDVIKWKHFPRYWPFVWGIHRSPVNSPHKGQWHGALMFSLICVWINGWVSNPEAGDWRRHRGHYDCNVMIMTLELRQNGHRFADNIFKLNFLWWKLFLFIQIWQKFNPQGSINNNPSLVQVMAWHWPGDKPMMASSNESISYVGLWKYMQWYMDHWKYIRNNKWNYMCTKQALNWGGWGGYCLLEGLKIWWYGTAGTPFMPHVYYHW